MDNYLYKSETELKQYLVKRKQYLCGGIMMIEQMWEPKLQIIKSILKNQLQLDIKQNQTESKNQEKIYDNIQRLEEEEKNIIVHLVDIIDMVMILKFQTKVLKLIVWKKKVFTKIYKLDKKQMQLKLVQKVVYSVGVVEKQQNQDKEFIQGYSQYCQSLAPLGKRCLDFFWRIELKYRDELNVFNIEKQNWMPATVLESKKIKVENDVIYQVKIGYRIFSNLGQDIDNQGRRYIGLGQQYDEWINNMSPIIQEANTLAGKFYKNMDFEQKDRIDDWKDNVYFWNQKNLFAVPRDQFKNKQFIDFVNNFGNKKGFEIILNQIKQGMDINELADILEMMGNLNPILHRSFIVKYVQYFKDLVFNNLEKTRQFEHLIKYNFQNISLIFKNMEVLLKRYLSNQEAKDICDDFKLKNFVFHDQDITYEFLPYTQEFISNLVQIEAFNYKNVKDIWQGIKHDNEEITTQIIQILEKLCTFNFKQLQIQWILDQITDFENLSYLNLDQISLFEQITKYRQILFENFQLFEKLEKDNLAQNEKEVIESQISQKKVILNRAQAFFQKILDQQDYVKDISLLQNAAFRLCEIILFQKQDLNEVLPNLINNLQNVKNGLGFILLIKNLLQEEFVYDLKGQKVQKQKFQEHENKVEEQTGDLTHNSLLFQNEMIKNDFLLKIFEQQPDQKLEIEELDSLWENLVQNEIFQNQKSLFYLWLQKMEGIQGGSEIISRENKKKLFDNFIQKQQEFDENFSLNDFLNFKFILIQSNIISGNFIPCDDKSQQQEEIQGQIGYLSEKIENLSKNLVKKLPMSPQIYKVILSLQNLKEKNEFDNQQHWDQFFQIDKSPQMFMYYLLIVNYVLRGKQNQQNADFINSEIFFGNLVDYQKFQRDWAFDFFRLGGAEDASKKQMNIKSENQEKSNQKIDPEIQQKWKSLKMEEILMEETQLREILIEFSPFQRFFQLDFQKVFQILVKNKEKLQIKMDLEELIKSEFESQNEERKNLKIKDKKINFPIFYKQKKEFLSEQLQNFQENIDFYQKKDQNFNFEKKLQNLLEDMNLSKKIQHFNQNIISAIKNLQQQERLQNFSDKDNNYKQNKRQILENLEDELFELNFQFFYLVLSSDFKDDSYYTNYFYQNSENWEQLLKNCYFYNSFIKKKQVSVNNFDNQNKYKSISNNNINNMNSNFMESSQIIPETFSLQQEQRNNINLKNFGKKQKQLGKLQDKDKIEQEENENDINNMGIQVNYKKLGKIQKMVNFYFSSIFFVFNFQRKNLPIQKFFAFLGSVLNQESNQKLDLKDLENPQVFDFLENIMCLEKQNFELSVRGNQISQVEKGQHQNQGNASFIQPAFDNGKTKIVYGIINLKRQSQIIEQRLKM
ncbi:hypothetical protein PPERSA_01425 [Pseudocohnilembus persalinus]|uniref:Uncharacterized protein n=1 Tax=Pseudocohnilembus persalinus TaxID=266149 RepID=A0A0V0QH30_PSEPJ|nr:hypothetical protein PPERSA_01425 [Pseudocohnilembus persalinus]|eukprot:KRX01522.1 hypothetical protein PPERSA_01425 [Pseudocohnilembus persalinus]